MPTKLDLLSLPENESEDMKPNYTGLLQDAVSEPVNNRDGIPLWMSRAEEHERRIHGEIGYIKCQHCAKVFRVLMGTDDRQTEVESAESFWVFSGR